MTAAMTRFVADGFRDSGGADPAPLEASSIWHSCRVERDKTDASKWNKPMQLKCHQVLFRPWRSHLDAAEKLPIRIG
jgi:hypothetical protein